MKIVSALRGAFFIFTLLENNTRYTLGKSERLKSRKTIEEMFKSGKSFSHYPFRVIYLMRLQNSETKLPALQCAFSVGTKHFKKATDRNRIKRLMREGYRLQKNKLQLQCESTDIQLNVFIIYTGNEVPKYELVFEKMGTLINRCLKMANENNTATT